MSAINNTGLMQWVVTNTLNSGSKVPIVAGLAVNFVKKNHKCNKSQPDNINFKLVRDL
jgi:hypothetical protein